MCASPTLVHTRTSGFGDCDERADLAGVVHAELDDRDLGTVAQLDERQRQADVVVQIAAIAEDAVAGRQQIGGDFLGRRLSGAAGDGDDRGAGLRGGPRAPSA